MNTKMINCCHILREISFIKGDDFCKIPIVFYRYLTDRHFETKTGINRKIAA